MDKNDWFWSHFSLIIRYNTLKYAYYQLIMAESLHHFSIPVMGTGHSIDSPIRVGPYGINSVISIVDDLLVERIRRHYCNQYDLPYENISRNAEDGRARRITAYLDMVKQIVHQKFEEVQQQSFGGESDKRKYFELLPDGSPLKDDYNQYLSVKDEEQRQLLAEELTRRMRAGSIDVNIMAKVDKLNYQQNGTPMSSEFSDASAALRGYANSSLSSSLVLSAGFNPRLYNYISEFKDFYRDAKGAIKKKIILKVSDFRSALIQGKYLAKKGLEVFEYRIESGLNCGGHAFASDGYLLPSLLREFQEKREMLTSAIKPLIKQFYKEERDGFSDEWSITEPRLTVQGGIGTNGEARRLMEEYGMDATGWGSPFLLVPEATTVDQPTRRLLQEAQKEDLFLSKVSPLGVPYNNVKNTGSYQRRQELIEKGKPGSPCPKGFLKFNTEFTEEPICTASREYQSMKLDQIAESEMEPSEKERKREQVLNKACLCNHLGNGALINLGILEEHRAPQAICPGPNIEWFEGEYTLREMVDHIYGRCPSLVPSERPHMFAREIELYVDYYEDRIEQFDGSNGERNKLKKFKNNLEDGMEYCLEIAASDEYEGEHLASIPPTVKEQRQRLESLFESIQKRSVATSEASP